MDSLRWIEVLLLPHTARAELVRAWIEQRLPARSVLRQWRARGAPHARRRWAVEQESRCRDLGWRVIAPGEVEYPPRCLQLHDPPAVLFVKGDVSVLAAAARVGVVGSRRGTARGRLCAEAVGTTLARAGVAVVSGLARGIDGAAHRGCLTAGGRPIGVLGTAVDRVYPASHRALHEQVAAAGCLVSEYPPGTPTRPHQFLARNRILAALGQTLVVVEAGARSGALSTVDFATQLGSEIMAVPGPVDCPHSLGTLRLLRDGCTLVRDGRDVLDSLGLQAPAEESAVEPVMGVDARPATAETIARRLGWNIARTLSYLTEQEAEGRVRRLPGGRFAHMPTQSSLAGDGEPPLT